MIRQQTKRMLVMCLLPIGEVLYFPAAVDGSTTPQQISMSDLVAYLNGVLTGLNFDIHDDISRQATTPSSSDRFIFSAETISGDPNTYITFSRLRQSIYTAINSLDDAITEAGELADIDTMLMYSDDYDDAVKTNFGDLRNFLVSAAGVLTALEAMSSAQESSARTAIGAADASHTHDYGSLGVEIVPDDEVTLALDNIQLFDGDKTETNVGGMYLFRTPSGTGYASSLTSDVEIKIGDSGTERDLFTGQASSSVRRVQKRELLRNSYMLIVRTSAGYHNVTSSLLDPTSILRALTVSSSSLRTSIRQLLTFDLHDDVGTELVQANLASDDRMLISDENASGDPNRYVTLQSLAAFFLDLHERISTQSTSLANDDRILVTDNSASGEPARYATLSTLRNFIGGLPITIVPDKSGCYLLKCHTASRCRH